LVMNDFDFSLDAGFNMLKNDFKKCKYLVEIICKLKMDN
jgi:hypothetical protein